MKTARTRPPEDLLEEWEEVLEDNHGARLDQRNDLEPKDAEQGAPDVAKGYDQPHRRAPVEERLESRLELRDPCGALLHGSG